MRHSRAIDIEAIAGSFDLLLSPNLFRRRVSISTPLGNETAGTPPTYSMVKAKVRSGATPGIVARGLVALEPGSRAPARDRRFDPLAGRRASSEIN
jgi:hypothetical protein